MTLLFYRLDQGFKYSEQLDDLDINRLETFRHILNVKIKNTYPLFHKRSFPKQPVKSLEITSINRHAIHLYLENFRGFFWFWKRILGLTLLAIWNTVIFTALIFFLTDILRGNLKYTREIIDQRVADVNITNKMENLELKACKRHLVSDNTRERVLIKAIELKS